MARLNNGVGSLLDLSRLEAGVWEPHRTGTTSTTSSTPRSTRSRSATGKRVRLSVPADMPPIFVDFEQWVRVLRNLIENALVYSPADSEVRVAAADVGDRIGDLDRGLGPRRSAGGARAYLREVLQGKR